MGYKFIEKENTWTVWHCERHPITRVPKTFRRKGLKSEAQARKTEKELVKQVHDFFRQKMIPDWKTGIESFLDSQRLRGLTAHTIHSEDACLRKYTQRWENRLIDTITKADIFAIIHECMQERSEAHKKYVLKCIRAVFNHAIQMQWVIHNPTPLLKFKSPEKIKPVLTEKQVGIFLEKAREFDSEWYPHWVCAIYTGMRNGELYALQWDCVDIDEEKITVKRAWNNRDGFKDTKSGHDRIVPIAPGLKPLLNDLYVNRVDNFVLPRLHKWDKAEQARDLRAFLLGIGLPQIRFHDLRATWATILLGQGIPPGKVMAMGGWRDMKTMMIYMRKSGIDVSESLANLSLHQHNPALAEVLLLKK